MTQSISKFLQERKSLAWLGAVLAWVGVILLSSTSVAGQLMDGLFTREMATHVRPYDTHDLYNQYHAHFVVEKNFHLAMFVVFTLLLWRLLPHLPAKPLIIFLLGALIGCCSEILQLFFPGRDPAVRDVLINTLGAGIGTAIGWARSAAQISTQRHGATSIYQ